MSQNKDHTTPPRAEEALANTEHLNGDVEARARFYLGAAHSHLDTAWRTLNEALDLTQATGIRQKVNVSREHIRELAQMKGSDLEVLEVTGKSGGWTDEELSTMSKTCRDTPSSDRDNWRRVNPRQQSQGLL